MHCLPIIQRELQIAARSRTTYKQRMLAAGAASAVVILFALFTPALSSTSGRYLFKVVSWGGWIICFLEGLRETSDSLSQERRDGTLGLLFLTDLGGYDLILGKLAAAVVKSFTILLAMLPAFALPIWLGGVTAGEFWRVTLSFGVTLLFSMTAGIFVSANSRSAFAALMGGFLLASALVLIPAASIAASGPIPNWLAGSLGMFLFSSDAQFTVDSSLFWKALFYSLAVCTALFLIAGRCVRNFSLGDENVKRDSLWQRLLRPTSGYSSYTGGFSTRQDPAVWWAERTLPGRRILWIVIAIAIVASFIIGGFAGNTAMFFVFPTTMFLVFLIKLWAAVLAVQPFNTARRSGALELLLCTPITGAKLIRGQMVALRGYFTIPGLAACFGVTIAGSLGSALFSSKATGFEIIIALGLGVFWFLSFLLDLNALAYMGLWLGLTEPQIPKAVTKTVVRVLLLPWLTGIIPCVGIFGMIIVPWVWIVWGSKQLNQRLHHETASQYSAEAQNSGWFKSLFT
jgi:hypothetical protein